MPRLAMRPWLVDDLLTTYLREIGAIPLLSPDEEARLATRIREGDADAVDALVRANLRFVVCIARKYQNRGVSLPDLINEGNIGLLRAAPRFDERRGVRFISYAVWWVRQSVVRAVADQGRLVRIPLQHAGALARLSRRTRQLEQQLGRAPTRDELAAGSGAAAGGRDLESALVQTYLSLDAAPANQPDRELRAVTADRHSPAADDDMITEALRETIGAALAILPARDVVILRLYFGFDGDALTLEDIGARLGITRERVRQLKARALERVRGGPHGGALAAFSS